MALLRTTPVGNHSSFPGVGMCYRTEDGFLLGQTFGGSDKCLSRVEQFEAREDDIIVASFPKAGSTWLAQLVYTIATDFDFETVSECHIWHRYSILNVAKTLIDIESKESPRFIKCHYPYSLLPRSIIDKKCKMVYIMRNPKDTLVSYFHFAKSYSSLKYDDSFETFFDLFLRDDIPFSPYWKHCLQFWDHRNDDNVFILTYEQLKQEFKPTIRRLSAFLNKNPSDELISRLEKFCSFGTMKEIVCGNPDLDPMFSSILDSTKAPFMRKGEIGDWKNYFTDDMDAKMNDYIASHFNGLEFVYE